MGGWGSGFWLVFLFVLFIYFLAGIGNFFFFFNLFTNFSPKAVDHCKISISKYLTCLSFRYLI